MATRSIQDPRDRLATILVAPLMTCSARPAGVCAADRRFIPQRDVAGGLLNLQGLVLFALYAAGIVSAMLVAWVMKKWRRDKSEHALLLELPSYRLPHPRDLAIGLWERAWIFLRRVGGIILALTILLWFLLSFPGAPVGATGPAIDYSFAGRIGHAMDLGVRAARLQLADLHRADPGPGRARSGGVVAGHGVRAVAARRCRPRRRCRR
jgi:ferrous iron transport protein B